MWHKEVFPMGHFLKSCASLQIPNGLHSVTDTYHHFDDNQRIEAVV